MHHVNLVIISGEGDLETEVSKAMGPYEPYGNFWDWYQIGGRWTGVLDGYDPTKDERNLETCSSCQGMGTGNGSDNIESDARQQDLRHICERCRGKGKQVKWPTFWERYEGDVMPIENLTEEQLQRFYRVVLPDGYEHFACERWTPWTRGGFSAQEIPSLEWLKETFPKHRCVVVDNHS